MSAIPALKTSDIIFPTLSTNFSETLSSLKRSALSISNRLNSIIQDAEFVCAVADAYSLPLVANERCGSWYIPPCRKAESAYFKSTDGHTGEWSFSLRRLNTQVLDVVGKSDGCIIVDSTRRGKSMPDALLKTVPIWCYVLNRVLFPELTHALYTPPQSISESEHTQIEARLDGFVQQLKDLNLEIAALRSKISKPLRPLWITRESSLPPSPPSFSNFHPIVLCTASRRVKGAEVSEGGYIQGAGDDAEGWSSGLTPPLFWSNQTKLLATNEEDLPEVIKELLNTSQGSTVSNVILIKPTSCLYVGSLDSSSLDGFDTVISCGLGIAPEAQPGKKVHLLQLKCRTGKLGSRDLREELPKLEQFFLNLKTDPGKILIRCATGKDLSLGVALSILCLFSEDNGTISRVSTTKDIDKSFIHQRFSWISTSYPTANPARATLQSINAFLMGPRPSPTLSSSPCPDPPATSLSTLTLSPPSKPPPTSTHTLFTSLTGPWTLRRTLRSSLPTHSSGTFSGTCTFASRLPTSPSFVAEYLYSETGTFRLATGMAFEARKQYAYRYSTEKDEVSVWFVEEATRREDPGVVGMFVEMGLESGEEEEGRVKVCEGREVHLCGEDLYRASYRFGSGVVGEQGGKEGERQEAKEGKANENEWWEVRYDVKGPKKDYVSETRYER